MKNKIEHIGGGSRVTCTFFKGENRETVKVCVWLESECTISNNNTYYKFAIETKGFKCRNFDFRFISKTSLDDRYKEHISKQQLYQALHNHWNKLNPFRLFRAGQNNSDFVFNGEVTQIIADTKHKAY